MADKHVSSNTRQSKANSTHKRLATSIQISLRRNKKVTRPKPNWMRLPHDLFIRIFSFVAPTDRCNLRIVNSTFLSLIDHPSNWVTRTVRLLNVHKYDEYAWKFIKKRNMQCLELGKLSKKSFKKVCKELNSFRSIRISAPLKVSNLQCLQYQKTSLQVVSIRDANLLPDKDLIATVVSFSKLTSLEICNISNLKDDTLKQFAQLKNLTSLSLCKANAPYQYGFQISGSGLQYVLFRLPKLKSLTLFAINGMDFSLSTALTSPAETDPTDIEDDDDPPFRNLQLQTLRLPFSLNFPLSDTALKQLETVQTLSLHESYLLRRRDLLKQEVIRIFQRLGNVKKLDLSSSNCQNDVLANLPRTVEWLDLRDCYSVSVLGIHALAESVGPNIKYLGLALCNRLSAQLLSSFERLFPNLEELDLSCCRAVTTAHFKVFLKLTKLRILRLVGCPQITEESIQKAREESENRILITGPRYIYKQDNRRYY